MNGNDRHNDLNVTWTAIVGFVGGILIFAFIVVVQIYFQRTEQAQYQQKIVAQVPEQLGQLQAGQLATINSYRLIDEARGIVAIPIEQAMEALVRDPADSMQAIQAAAATQPAATAPAAGKPATASAPGTAATASAPATQPGRPQP